jgi:adenylate kinase family enzyme
MKCMSSKVVVLTGPPGAGKSTIAQDLARSQPKAVHLHTDDFWHYIVSGAIPPYEPASDAQNQTVMEVIAKAAFTYAGGGFMTVVDGIVGPWMLGHFRARAMERPDVQIDYVVLRPRRDVALARAQARTASSALIEEAPILAMWDQFADLGALDHHALDTSDDETTRSAQRVTDAISGSRFRLSF